MFWALSWTRNLERHPLSAFCCCFTIITACSFRNWRTTFASANYGGHIRLCSAIKFAEVKKFFHVYKINFEPVGKLVKTRVFVLFFSSCPSLCYSINALNTNWRYISLPALLTEAMQFNEPLCNHQLLFFLFEQLFLCCRATQSGNRSKHVTSVTTGLNVTATKVSKLQDKYKNFWHHESTPIASYFGF